MFRTITGRCIRCGNCSTVHCAEPCTGCGACQLACPVNAIEPEGPVTGKYNVTVNGKQVEASGTVKDAIRKAGIKVSRLPEEGRLFVPCSSGGCWACSVLGNGKLVQSCVTPLSEGMVIETTVEPPLRFVSGFGPHTAGGVGTPYNSKREGPVEVVCFTHGCNLRCLQCQNSQIAFTAGLNLMEAEEAATVLLGLESIYMTGTVTISGGECTLNRKWLTETIKAIRILEPEVNIHVDTNGTVLTRKYIDDLVRDGMTQIGIDLKGIRVPTFMEITGIDDKNLAAEYLKNSWEAFRYISNKYRDIFVGIGVPYNRALISMDEIQEIAYSIASVNSEIQVTLLDYRPEFRRVNIERPLFDEMIAVKNLMNDAGLQNVIAQTPQGFVGP